MSDTAIIVISIIVILIIVGIIIGLVIYFTQRKNTSTLSTSLGTFSFEGINACLTNCERNFEACQQACDNLGPDCGPGVQLSCVVNESVCNRNCYPSIFTIRNGSVYKMYFFRPDGTLIGSLNAWSPSTLTLQASDFPMTCCSCNPINTCDCLDRQLGVIIQTPGCYILWYFTEFYTTSEICHTG